MAAVTDLDGILRPTFPLVSKDGEKVTVKNFVGSVRMPSGTVLEVEPKVSVDTDWTSAVVQLLQEDSRISVTGSQRSKQGGPRRDLTEAVALEYVRRLECALAKEGPLQVFERRNLLSRRLNGRLDVGTYARNAWRDPILFPVRRDELTVANDFARGLSVVSRVFRRSVTDARMASRLRRIESAVLPGLPLPEHVDPMVAFRRLPAQWARYRPAWDIAAAVLRNRSIINDPGSTVGLEVAVESWPLLETLLERALEAVARASPGRRLRPKVEYPLLKIDSSIAGRVVPDGVLELDSGEVLATFEAKYTLAKEHPTDEHRYQALAAAAALRSPLSVLVYPGSEPPKLYDVQGFGGRPTHLATIGLKLFEYDRKRGAERCAERMSDLIAKAETRRRATQK